MSWDIDIVFILRRREFMKLFSCRISIVGILVRRCRGKGSLNITEPETILGMAWEIGVGFAACIHIDYYDLNST
jgi:hypothetical protein